MDGEASDAQRRHRGAVAVLRSELARALRAEDCLQAGDEALERLGRTRVLAVGVLRSPLQAAGVVGQAVVRVGRPQTSDQAQPVGGELG